MINACMIDGFGWFGEDDYRRAWLLFDEVDYLFPGELAGPLWYPTTVFEETEYRAVRMSTAAEADSFAEAVEADHGDETFRGLVA
jgi:hypothetical protein